MELTLLEVKGQLMFRRTASCDVLDVAILCVCLVFEWKGSCIDPVGVLQLRAAANNGTVLVFNGVSCFKFVYVDPPRAPARNTTEEMS
jgi:hypothetical protein